MGCGLLPGCVNSQHFLGVLIPSTVCSSNRKPQFKLVQTNRKLISLNREFEVECSGLNSVVLVLYISLLCHLLCADLVLGYLPSL